ncbi:ribose ABC transporter permease [Lactiplantibacillus fabifermentans T30PCM01]|uniref:Ribose ABC transporter permease n=1 Tax=Lactiplantibacillus fabifermentans T30PCM01 TaxID=1400520 RepID=W6T4N2_9LACO|nr:ribose ABC transporter permease [Lactiplantibacillus fabifermentans T30PCM01]
MQQVDKSETPKKKFDAKQLISKLGTVIALLVLVIAVTIMDPEFLMPDNLLNLLRQTSINAIIAFGMTFVILTGGIDLSVGSILAFTGAVTASTIAGGTPAWLAVIFGLLLGGLFGCLNGLIIAYGKAAAFIATLATMTIFRGATYVFTNGNPVTGTKINNSFFFQYIGRGYLFGIPFPIIIMVIAVKGSLKM